MKTKHLLWVFAALTTMLLTGCSNTDDSFSQDSGTLTPIRISAGYDAGISSKTSYAESGTSITATWDAGDQLYVCYNGKVNTLSLTDGAGTSTATFEGSIIGTPTSNSVLICYVKDANNPSAVTVSNTGEYTYQSGTFLSQDGTLEGAAKCNLYYGTTTYGTGDDLSCTFSVNTSMMKFTVYAPDDVNAGDDATLTYKSGDTEVSKASFTVSTNGKNTVYLTIPAGQYTGAQTLVYKSGDKEESETLSATKATFKAGQTYSKTISYGSVKIDINSSNWSTALTSFNEEMAPAPIAKFSTDVDIFRHSFIVTRSDGVIDLNGHTLSALDIRNDVAGKSITLTNGTISGSGDVAIDGHPDWADFYHGTVILENLTVNKMIFTDGHLFIINSGIYNEQIFNVTTSGYPGKLIINGGYFKKTINATYSNATYGIYELYGGKYAVRPEDSWCADGYSVKANTDADSATYPYIVSAD